MKNTQFDKLGRKYFGELLEPYGYSCEKSRLCTFYKQVSDDIYHVIVPDLRMSGTTFIVVVYATSPLIEPEFANLFPDDLGITSGLGSSLHVKRGIGVSQTHFRCNKKEGFIRNFTKQAAPAILKHALPFLEKNTTLEEMIPHIHDDFYMGMALWHTGKRDEAVKLLKPERDRLSGLEKDAEGSVIRAIKFLDNLLRPRLIG